MINLIITPKGKAKNVSGLSWLTRHGIDIYKMTFVKINDVTIETFSPKGVPLVYNYDGLLIAEHYNGTKYYCTFASLIVFFSWKEKNRTLKHLNKAVHSGNLITYTRGESK